MPKNLLIFPNQVYMNLQYYFDGLESNSSISIQPAPSSLGHQRLDTQDTYLLLNLNSQSNLCKMLVLTLDRKLKIYGNLVSENEHKYIYLILQ